MRKIVIGVSLLLINFLFIFTPAAHATPDRENGTYCSGFYGYISTQNWPGGSITISCEGDNGPYCSGDRQTIALNASGAVPYSLSHCSCGEFVPTGLIKIETALPASCAMATDLSQYVAQNGWDRGADFGIGCTAPNTPTPTPTIPRPTNTPIPTPTRTPTPRPSSTPTPTRTPTPTVPSCATPGAPQVQVSCPFCQ